MTSPVRGNFGHIREPGVLLLTKEDSKMKHERNSILAGKSFAALFTLGLASSVLVKESILEKEIRAINIKHYPNLPYAMCVLLRDASDIQYNGVEYKNPFYEADLDNFHISDAEMMRIFCKPKWTEEDESEWDRRTREFADGWR